MVEKNYIWGNMIGVQCSNVGHGMLLRNFIYGNAPSYKGIVVAGRSNPTAEDNIFLVPEGEQRMGMCVGRRDMLVPYLRLRTCMPSGNLNFFPDVLDGLRSCFYGQPLSTTPCECWSSARRVLHPGFLQGKRGIHKFEGNIHYMGAQMTMPLQPMALVVY